MDISLTPELEELVNKKVESGVYKSPVEVVSEGLRLLAEHDRLKEEKIAGLRQAIEEGLNSGDSIPLDIEALKKEARERMHQPS